MTFQQRFLVLAILASTAAVGCSGGGSFHGMPPAGGGAADELDSSSETAAAGADTILEASAGAGGDGGAGVPASVGGSPATDDTTCTAARDCDDGQPCNGKEACVEGACEPGNVIACDVGMECSDAEAGECIFTDPSPWVVYQADDETPGVAEVYAVKRGLLGKMEPIKLNPPLDEGWRAFRPGTWSPDHELYSFSVIRDEPYDAAVEVVHFGKGLPGPAIQLAGEDVQWSPSGKAFAIAEPHGIAIYAYSGAGKFELTYRDADPAREQHHGWWAQQDAFMFASQLTTNQLSNISRIRREVSGWKTATLLENLDLFWFEVTPSLTEIVYATGGTNASIYSLLVTGADSPHLLSGGQTTWLSWSADAQRYMLQTQSSASEMTFYLGGGNLADRYRQKFAAGRKIVSAGFAPDSQTVLCREPGDGWGQWLWTYDLATATWSDLHARVSDLDELAWSHDAGWLAVPSRETEASDIHLDLVSVGAKHSTQKVDAIPYNLQFYNLQFNKQNEFFAYFKGDGAKREYDAAYVDLRYPKVAPKPVRLPGEGTMRTMSFDPDGSALYYVRQRDNGARDCYYLDLSQQVAKDAVKVNRSGRVEHCYAQPLSD